MRSRTRIVAEFILLICMTGLAPLAHAAGPVKLTASDAAASEQFGNAVSISGDTAIVGAYFDDHAGAISGSVYIYRWNGTGWTEEAKLTASDAAAGDQFGWFVSIDGNTAVIGSYLDDDSGIDAGSAYVFTRTGSTWTQQAKLTAADAATNDRFGFSVSISGDTVIVGSYLDDDFGTDSGSVYIYTRTGSTWALQTKLAASDAATPDAFGWSVSIDGDTVLVGARIDADTAGTNQGSAYVFTRTGSTWTEQQKLTASDAAANDQFGFSVSLDADTALVGVPFDDNTGLDSGSAYVFTRTGSTWTEQQKLTATDEADGDNFGYSISVSGDTVLVGAYFDDAPAGFNEGSASVFTRTGTVWTEQARLTAPDAAMFDQFGWSVSIDGNMALVGVPHDDDAGASSGSVHIFERIGGFWIGPDHKVVASDATASDQLGRSVSIDGDTAIVGAYFDDGPAGLDQGSAYVFTRTGSTWTQQAKLTASDAAPTDFFGFSVSISGDTAIVGAYNVDGVVGFAHGAAYIFTRAGTIWTQQVKLTASDAGAGDRFGLSVSIDGDTAIVGADLDDGAAGADQGSAYVFTRTGTTWTQQAKLTTSDAGAGDNLGWSTSIDGDTAIVGAHLDDGGAGVDKGSAYIFTRTGTTWTQQAKLIASDAGAGDRFGISVSIFEDTGIVGAYLDDDAGSNSGSAYIFTRTGSTWTQQAKLTATDAAPTDFFGWSTSIDGDTAIVGAFLIDGPAGADQGAAYVFTRTDTTWTQHAKLTALDAAPFDQFGISVALSSDTVIVGAYFDDDAAGTNQGSASFFNVGEECLPVLVHNTTADTFHNTLSDGVNNALATHTIIATAPAFFALAPTDYLTKALSINSTSRIRQPYLNSITLANGASLNAASGQNMTLNGIVDVPLNAASTLRAGPIRQNAGGSLTLLSGSALNMQSPSIQLDGNTLILPNASLVTTGPIATAGNLSLFNATIASPAFEIQHGGRFVGDGTLSTSVTNSDQFITVNSTLISDDLTNNAGAKVTVQIGTLTLLGSLTNNGTILGDLQTLLRAGTLPGDGFSVGGHYTAGSSSSLLMSSSLWRVRVGGNYNVAINNNTLYDMSLAELNLTAGLPSNLELMSTDIGSSSNGFDRTLAGHYPIGTLRLTGNTTNLLDSFDNDNLGQATKEALYVTNLIIDAGATLNTNGCTIYYSTLTNNGSVDNASNLVQIVACIADLTGDGFVNGADLGFLLGSWAQPGITDFNGDGNTDGADLGFLLGAWGPCP